MVPLFHRDFGGAGKPPLLILHGLLGSSRNWQTVGADLAATYHVLALDLRNHGLSPHDDAHDYDAMEQDLSAWMDAQGMLSATILGHSMGGKAAMAFACRRPGRVDALVIVDIAPKDYTLEQHDENFEAMAALDLGALKSRQEAETLLGARIKDWAMMKFVATNLERDADGKFFWRVNLPVLSRELRRMGRTPFAPDDKFKGPTLFVTGGKSRYVKTEDLAAIHRHFPQAKVETIAGSGHNPHIETRAEFVEVLKRFL